MWRDKTDDIIGLRMILRLKTFYSLNCMSRLQYVLTTNLVSEFDMFQ